MSTERPILFTGPMVCAILDGRKTQTRRIVDVSKALTSEHRKIGFTMNADAAVVGDLSWIAAIGGDADGVKELQKYQQLNVPVRHPEEKEEDFPWSECGRTRLYCPHGSIGDRLWVKETWAYGLGPIGKNVDYRADCELPPVGNQKWKPSIFMPRWASRITLEISSVRVERLQDISEEDAKSEGITDSWPEIECNSDRPFRDGYRWLWNSINLKPSPIYEKIDGKKVIVSYESYPWSNDDFDASYPGVREDGIFRGKPITVTANSWVWILNFNLLRVTNRFHS